MQSIFFLSHDFIKLVEGEVLVGGSVVQDVGIVHHFYNLLIVHSLPQLLSDVLHFLEVDEPFTIGVIQSEYFLKPLLGFGITQSIADDLKKLLEVNGPPLRKQVTDHEENNIISTIETELLQNLLNLCRINSAPIIFVKQIKR